MHILDAFVCMEIKLHLGGDENVQVIMTFFSYKGKSSSRERVTSPQWCAY